MSFLTEINILIDTHKGDYLECKGCSKCQKIQKLRQQHEMSKNKEYQKILKKGQAMTREDITYLLSKDFTRKEIYKAMKMDSGNFNELLRQWGINLQPNEVELTSSKKFSEEDYRVVRTYIEKGFSQTMIGRKLGIPQSTISYHLKKIRANG